MLYFLTKSNDNEISYFSHTWFNAEKIIDLKTFSD
jgi:hypothetical protein